MMGIRSGPVLAVVALFVLAPLGCAPAPKNTPCENDGDCLALNKGYEYCLQKRCVKCISKSMCRADELCVDGECKRR
jgi:hypothetical protein